MSEEAIPSESQTIAAKRSVRLAEKLGRARQNIFVQQAWWNTWAVELVVIMLVEVVTLQTVWPFVGTQVPSTQFSGPVVPIVAKAISLTGLPFAASVQVVNILAFLAFPVGVYVFVKKIAGRKLPALLALIVSSLPWGMFAESRVYSSFVGQDTPHIVSLSVIPWVLSVVLVFIRIGGLGNLLWSAAGMAIVGLVSPSGFLSLVLFCLVTVFSEMLLGNGRLKLTRFLIVVLFALAFDAFWFNPPFAYWLMVGPSGEEMRGILGKIVPISLFGVPVLAAFGFLLFDRKPSLQPLFLAFFYTLTFVGIVTVAGGQFTNPTAKYLSELGVAVAFLIGIGSVKLIEVLRNRLNIFDINVRTISAYGGLAIVFIVLSTWMVGGRDRLYFEEKQVLGLWTEVDKDEFWMMRDRFSASPLAFVGKLISGSSVIVLGTLAFKLSRKGAV